LRSNPHERAQRGGDRHAARLLVLVGVGPPCFRRSTLPEPVWSRPAWNSSGASCSEGLAGSRGGRRAPTFPDCGSAGRCMDQPPLSWCEEAESYRVTSATKSGSSRRRRKFVVARRALGQVRRRARARRAAGCSGLVAVPGDRRQAPSLVVHAGLVAGGAAKAVVGGSPAHAPGRCGYSGPARESNPTPHGLGWKGRRPAEAHHRFVLGSSRDRVAVGSPGSGQEERRSRPARPKVVPSRVKPRACRGRTR